jgi:transposase-like protein
MRRFFIVYFPVLEYYFSRYIKTGKERRRPKFRSFPYTHWILSVKGLQLLQIPLGQFPVRNVMIREKAIFIKLNQLNSSDQQLFDFAVSSFNPSKCTCPECGALGHMVSFSSYRRDLITVSDGKRMESSLIVPRFLCSSCGHTHAILPDVLVPYSSYSLQFILSVLLDYLQHKRTVSDLCWYWEISVSTLYDWIHLFLNHYNSWCRSLDRILRISHKAISAVCGTESFPSRFFAQFHFSFLQHHKTSPYNSVRPPDRRYKTFST